MKYQGLHTIWPKVNPSKHPPPNRAHTVLGAGQDRNVACGWLTVLCQVAILRQKWWTTPCGLPRANQEKQTANTYNGCHDIDGILLTLKLHKHFRKDMWILAPRGTVGINEPS